jgi:hypothetical protein
LKPAMNCATGLKSCKNTLSCFNIRSGVNRPSGFQNRR